jgi:hypothetical protein
MAAGDSQLSQQPPSMFGSICASGETKPADPSELSAGKLEGAQAAMGLPVPDGKPEPLPDKVRPTDAVLEATKQEAYKPQRSEHLNPSHCQNTTALYIYIYIC